MPSLSERRRNDLQVGIFVSAALLLTLFVSVNLTDIVGALFEKPVHYRVSYSIADGVKNLREGSSVRVGGLAMGAVEGVEIEERSENGVTESIMLVEFSLDTRVSLYPDPRIVIEASIVGSDAWVEIEDLGTRAGNQPLAAGTVIVGQTSSLLADALGGTLDDVEEIVANVKAGSAFVADLGGTYERDVQPVLDDAKAITENARAASADLPVITGDARSLVNGFKGDTWPAWVAQVDAALDNAVAVTDGTRDAIESNRPRFDEIVANTRDTTATASDMMTHLREETMPKVDRFISNGEEALASADGLLETLRDDYDDWSPQMNETLGNAALASQQLRLTMTEVRRSPWKVLYRPTPDELEHELLYDAARSFAVATGELKAAAESAERILQRHGDQLDGDPALRERLTRNLLDPLDKYKQAQDRLMSALFEE